MKKYETGAVQRIIVSLFISSFILHPSSFLHAADCAKDSDSCAGGIAKLSPFVEASRAENTASPAAPAPAKKRQASLKQAPAARDLAVSSAAAAAPDSASVPDGDLSSPAWLVLVAGGFAGLYFYLRGGMKKRRRK